jgi:hypothetical protein
VKGDRRPAWLLRKNARISALRRARQISGEVDDINAETWWQQIVEAAAELQLDTKPDDWAVWPDDDDQVSL